MTQNVIRAEPLDPRSFLPFGDVLAARGAPDRLINRGRCERFHDLARLDFGPDGQAGISLFRSEGTSLPLRLEMLERHPEGSQAFIPMQQAPFLVIVADDENGCPGRPRAFIAAPGQGVNILRGIWHGVLTPLGKAALFAVIDRIGRTPNLQEHWLEVPYIVEIQKQTTRNAGQQA